LESKETSPAQQKKVPTIFWIPTSETPPFFKSPKRRRNYGSRFKKKKKGKAISLKYHIRGRNPVYRRKPEFGKKIREIQGNQLCPVEKKFPVFLNSHQRKPRLFSKSQNGDEITVLRFFFKKKNEKNKSDFKKNRAGTPFTDAYRSVLKSPYKKKNFLLVN
jgi:hypothetical protein